MADQIAQAHRAGRGHSHTEGADDGRGVAAMLGLHMLHQLLDGVPHFAAERASEAVGTQIGYLLAAEEQLTGSTVQQTLERVTVAVAARLHLVLVAHVAEVVVGTTQTLVAIVDQVDLLASVTLHIPVHSHVLPGREQHSISKYHLFEINLTPAQLSSLFPAPFLNGVALTQRVFLFFFLCFF